MTLALDGYVTGTSSGSSTVATSSGLTTANANDVIVACVTAYVTSGSAPTVSSVSGGGLTWTKRVSTGSTALKPSFAANIDVWQAVASSTLSSVTVTATLSSASAQDADLVVFGVSGADTAAPSDPNSSLPAQASSATPSTTPSVSGVSTSSPRSLIYAVSFNGGRGANPGSGFSTIDASGLAISDNQYEIVAAKQSGITVSFGSGDQNSFGFLMVADAVQGAIPVGSAAGHATLSGAGIEARIAAGTAAGHAAVAAAGAWTIKATGSAAGHATASGTGLDLRIATGSAAGRASASGAGIAARIATGSAAGRAAVIGDQAPPSRLAPSYTSDDFLAAAQGLLPRGAAWPRDLGRVLTSFWQAIGDTLAAHAASAAHLLVDAFPPTTVQLLPEWQKTLGLPDPAWPPAPTPAEQQDQVWIKFVVVGGQSAGYFTDLAASFGESVTVKSRAPFRCGQSKCGQTCGTTEQFFVWDVEAPDTALQGVFNQMKPAHTLCVLNG